MLYHYKYPRSKIQKIQSFVNYIMLEVVLKAQKIPDTVFSEKLVLPKYVPFFNEINSDYILTPVEKMYGISKKLDALHLKILRKAVYENNRIEELCEGKHIPITYRYLESVFKQDFEKEMLNAIKGFCKNLYDNCLGLAPVYSRYGKLKNYHDLIVDDDGTCPFCGNSSMETKYSNPRNAFDHYLAKQTYPFVSINFKNLVPTCYTCNSLYKRTKDVLFYRGKRYKAFYPFAKDNYNININIKFKHDIIYKKDLSTDDIVLTCTCVGHQEETDNWMRIYDIQNRYKAKCCEKGVKASLTTIVESISTSKYSKDEILYLYEKNIMSDMNFLKVPFFKTALDSLNL